MNKDLKQIEVDCIEIDRGNGWYEVIITGKDPANSRCHYLKHIDYESMIFVYGYSKSLGMLYLNDNEIDDLKKVYIDIFNIEDLEV